MKKNTSGFTLVEVTVGSAIIVIVGLIILGLQYIVTNSQLFLTNASIEVEQANSNVSTIVREIRTARSSETGGYLIASASPQEIIFYSDIDFDSKSERVRYFLAGNELKKGVVEPVGFPAVYDTGTEKLTTVADYVQNGATTLFYYYNELWPTSSQNNPMSYPISLTDIRIVRVYLRVNMKANDSQNDYVLDTYSNIRTIKQNL